MKKLIVVLAIIALAAPAMAEVNLYGSARMWTYSATVSKEAAASGYEDTDTVWMIGPFSRFGATFKNGDVGGKFEMDGRMTASKSASSVGSTRIRHLYGTWNFGAGEMLVGQTWPITDQPVSGLQYSGDGLQSFGGVGAVDARIPQIRFTFGNFMFGFLSPDVYAGLSGAAAYTDTDATLPKIEAAFDLPLGDVGKLSFSAGYQTYDMENQAADQSESITSYLLAVRGKFNFGPAYVNAIVDWSQNPTNYGEAMGSGVDGAAVWDGTSVKDYTVLGFAVAVGFKINDMIGLEAGYGMDTGELDVSGGTYEQDHSAYYFQVPITLAPGVRVVPEFVKFDYGTTDINGTETDDGSSTAIGAVWYISF
jgi:hypothetical protein